MSKEIRETIGESLLEILPPLTNAVNDMINAAKGAENANKLSPELFPKVHKLSAHARKLLAPVYSYLSDENITKLSKSDIELFRIWLNALENLGKSIDIFLYLIEKSIEKNDISDQKEGHSLNDAVNFLFEASREIADLIDVLYK
ncbi:hypothetical protein [Bacillus halotolerans]|uniref:hypothetical protein n=1 Tax=Bacillus halotolerans TaxID=260554 RepID=UPI0018794AAC|nr:hypothetical protein [Bacillus halotolerans]MEC1542708.1 hypothetical protein [Bacillus halotolerans]